MSSTAADDIRKGDRRALARAITLVESTRQDHRAEADALVAELLPHTGDAHRVGITGAPGVGKSTFIEALGTHLTANDHTVAVLAVDPTSARSGGSILGDKTRMENLARDESAFIRPSPAGDAAGGVARRTREALLLCEAAGFDVVVVETVGVGQSEVAVADMVDTFVLLASPAGGDDLQGIKRGVMELADLAVVTKADGDLADRAAHAAADLRNALHLLRPRAATWVPEVLQCSAITGDGIAEVWDAAERHRDALVASGLLEDIRARQAIAAMWNEVREVILTDFTAHPAVRAKVGEVAQAVSEQRMSPGAGAAALLAGYREQPDVS